MLVLMLLLILVIVLLLVIVLFNTDQTMKNLIKVLIFIFIFLTLAAAQEKIPPPPTKITLPSDTTRVEPEAQDKIEAEKPQLQLPDVVVFGQDREVRVPGGKESLTPESPTLVKPESPYEPVSIWFGRESSKPQVEGAAGGLRKLSWISLQGGGYSTVLLDGGHWQKYSLGDYRARAWLDRSKGQFDNSSFSQGGLSGKVSYELQPQTVGTARAEYSRFSRRLHESELAKQDFSRLGSTGSFAAELQYDLNKLSDGRLGIEIGSSGVQSDTSEKRLDKTSDFWYDLNFSYSTQWSNLQITASGRYVREVIDLLKDSTSMKNSLGEIGAQGYFRLSNTLAAVFGFSYQSNAADSFATSSRISPFARINLTPNSRVGLTGIVFTGLEHKTFTQWWQENPYIGHRPALVADNTKLSLRVESDLELVPNLRLRGSFARSWMERMHYWEQNPLTRLIDLRQIRNTELTEIQIGMIADLSARTRLQASFVSYSDKIDDDGALPNLDRIPYRSDFRIPVRVSIQLLKDMYLGVQADINGVRRSRLNEASRLPAFGMMQSTLSKDFGKTISTFLSVNNILDSEYVVWENYPETGVTLNLGVRAKF